VSSARTRTLSDISSDRLPDEQARSETVLIVCSANQCRSPLAAALLRRELEHRDVVVFDAGFGEPGYPVTGDTLRVAEERGLDLGSHESAVISEDLIAQADLVLGMDRGHVRDIVIAVPEAWAKTFTLKELVRRADEVGPRQRGQSMEDWLERVQEGRSRMDLIGSSTLDDVADPTTNLSVDHATTAE
jgi:protein-tyrosine phosphatase